jgi:hypothetical protein
MTWRDRIASALVAMAVLGYALWLVAVDNPTESGIRAMVAAVLGLGFAASATAVVPGFGELIHGSRFYLAVASLLGLVALTAGVVAFVSADTTMLAVLVVATVVMWVMASVRHATATPARTPAPQRAGEGRAPTAAGR